MHGSTTKLLLSLNEIQTVVKTSAHHAGTSIAALTAGIRLGNEDAFREFHELYFDRLYQFLLVVARGNEHEARDALQETLVRVVRYARKFDSEEAFWNWLKVVARSAARDAGRRQHRYFNLLQKFALHSETHSPNPGTAPPLGDLLEESLEELPPSDRELIKAKYLQGATVRELASDRGLTEKAIESLLLRIRQRVRAFIVQKLRHK